MNFQRTISPAIVIADQPTEAELAALKAAGFVGVVNLRNDGEPEQPMGVALEGAKAKTLGLDYLHMGVGAAPLTQTAVNELYKFLDAHADGKTLVHCRKGGRAAAMVLLYEALKNEWTPAEAAAKGKAMGLDVDGGLRVMVENYLGDHVRPE
jgi:uncharacterized protein (TIGR01244 family)